ncbi:MAG: Iron-sulfur protein [Syntrophorhabdus sp. PtaU1.Bin058]|nr:MAG: Iron-sulfur protein [Syntrophorhabdus sp. PtaU1.Bin058]
MREIFFIKDRCVGCGACKAACVAEHTKNHHLYDSLSSVPMGRKRRTDRYKQTITEEVPHPVRCLHCDEPPCMEGCISGAIGRADRVYSKWDACVGCFMCVMNCPFGAVLPFFNKAVRCDQCLFTEKPACVRACPQNAIVYMESNEFEENERKRRWRDKTQKEIPLLKAKA